MFPLVCIARDSRLSNPAGFSGRSSPPDDQSPRSPGDFPASWGRRRLFLSCRSRLVLLALDAATLSFPSCSWVHDRRRPSLCLRQGPLRGCSHRILADSSSRRRRQGASCSPPPRAFVRLRRCLWPLLCPSLSLFVSMPVRCVHVCVLRHMLTERQRRRRRSRCRASGIHSTASRWYRALHGGFPSRVAVRGSGASTPRDSGDPVRSAFCPARGVAGGEFRRRKPLRWEPLRRPL